MTHSTSPGSSLRRSLPALINPQGARRGILVLTAPDRASVGIWEALVRGEEHQTGPQGRKRSLFRADANVLSLVLNDNKADTEQPSCAPRLHK